MLQHPSTQLLHCWQQLLLCMVVYVGRRKTSTHHLHRPAALISVSTAGGVSHMCVFCFDVHGLRASVQVVQFSDRTGRHHLLGLERFADHSGREAWDYSSWVRVYSSYLDERLAAFRSEGHKHTRS